MAALFSTVHLNLHEFSKNEPLIVLWKTELYVLIHEATYIYGGKYMQKFYWRKYVITSQQHDILTVVIYGSPVYGDKRQGIHF